MGGLRSKRELSGLSQIALSKKAEISRMRLQLAESGVLELRANEMVAVNQVLREAIQNRAIVLQNALRDSSEEAKGQNRRGAA